VIEESSSLDYTVDQPDFRPMTKPLIVAVPNLESYTARSGIGRVLHGLQKHWGDRVEVVSATLKSVSLPILRNFPRSVAVSENVHLILLPQLTGAQALRNTAGIPGIVIVHDVGIIDFPGDQEALDSMTNWSIRRSVLGLESATHIITVSEFTRRRLIYHFPNLAEKTTTIHDGVNEELFQLNSTQEVSRNIVAAHLGRRVGTPLLVYVGSEHPRKNVSALLRAFKLVQKSFPEAQLLKIGLAGNTRWREQTMQTLDELRIRPGNEFHLLERVDDELLAHAYRAADVFISASLYEGFGLPALEAMAIGTPVVVTNQGAFPEVVGTAGWIVEPTPEALANAVTSVIRGLNRIERVNIGRARAESLTWSAAADRYLEVMSAIAT
jgi:glycosyltransferase involved in cell wall biosynthesis